MQQNVESIKIQELHLYCNLFSLPLGSFRIKEKNISIVIARTIKLQEVKDWHHFNGLGYNFGLFMNIMKGPMILSMDRNCFHGPCCSFCVSSLEKKKVWYNTSNVWQKEFIILMGFKYKLKLGVMNSGADQVLTTFQYIWNHNMQTFQYILKNKIHFKCTWWLWVILN